MFDLNKVVLIGRATRDVEIRTFANGGKVARIGFAVSAGRKKVGDSQWEDEPCFLDVEAFNRGEKGKMADHAEQYLSKGSKFCVVGKLKMDSWTSNDGTKRTKIKVEADELIFLDSKKEPQTEAAEEAKEELFF